MWKTRLVQGGFPDGSFDIESCRNKGVNRLCRSMGDVELAEETKYGKSPDSKELRQLLNEFEVEYMIVSGFAAMNYGEPRYAKDFDVWVHSRASNSLRLFEAVKNSGVPLQNDRICRDIQAKTSRPRD